MEELDVWSETNVETTIDELVSEGIIDIPKTEGFNEFYLEGETELQF